MLILSLGGQIDSGIIWIVHQPWFSCCKSGIFRCVPGKRHSGIVTAHFLHCFQCFLRWQPRPQCYLIFIVGHHIIDLIHGCEIHIFHTNFLSLINKRNPTYHKMQRCQHLLGRIIYFPIREIVAHPSWLIVILDNIRQKSHIPGFLLAEKYCITVFICRDVWPVIPALLAGTAHRRTHIKHSGKISIVTNKVWQCIFVLIKNLAYAKGIIFCKSPVTQLRQEVMTADFF